MFYRASCAKRARSLGIAGSAVNLPDGRVEVMACGTTDALAQLAVWLARGPAGASVDRVDQSAAPCLAHAEFTTG